MTEPDLPAPSPDRDRESVAAPPAPPPIRWMTVAAVVGFLVFAGHIWSVGSGLYLDDHSHFAHLRHDDWSFASAVEAARLGIVGEVIDLWGRREAGLRFFRPIAFWIMKAEYTLGQWRPTVMHFASLAWHYACCMLVTALAFRCIGRRFWAMVAGCLMAIHPGHVATVAWVACQTELMSTAFLLAGVLFYARHAGWPRAAFAPKVDDQPETSRPGWKVTFSGFAAVLCYGLALGCRENAVLFPVICLAGDRLFGTHRSRRIRWEHLAMGLVFAVYLALRWHMLGGFPLPAKPYLIPVTDPEFPRFALDKISLYLTGLVAYVPVVPIGGRAFFTARPMWLYGGLGTVLLLLLVIWLAFRCRKPLLWPMVWVACTLAPVLPVFASSHHLYLPGAALSVLIASGLGALFGLNRRSGSRAVLPLRAIGVVLIVAHVIVLGGVTWALGFAFTRGTMVEDLVLEDVIERGPRLQKGDHLFFINLPVLAYYVVPALKTDQGLDELQGHALTFSPDLVRMQEPGRIEVLDRYRLRIVAPPSRGYLGGVTGGTLQGVMDLAGQIEEGKTLDGDLFSVTPTVVDESGIRELLFEFRRPMDSPDFHFYFGSPHFAAYPLDMKRFIAQATTRTATDTR